jgi:peptidoglycan/xylan/chitin deacetylase (PgdA/CDA1 family)
MRVILRAGLWLTLLAVGVAARDAKPKRQIAVTFDDLPAQRGNLAQMQEQTDKVLASITRHRIPAVGFVNEGKLYAKGEVDERIALLQKWLDAGLELGNHTFSHINNQQAPLRDYQDDVIRGETVTGKLLQAKGLKLRYFRHPFLFTGPTPEYKKGLDEFLAGRGYTVAPVTIDNSDYVFAYTYGWAQKRNDTATMKRVAEAYVPYMETMCDYFEELSRASQGREIKQILLVHVNEINAGHFDDVVAMLKQRGYEFITLEEALKDPAYQQPDAQMRWGLSWLHRWMRAKGQKGREEPDVPADIMKLYEQAQKK